MKRTIALLLVFVSIFAFASCASQASDGAPSGMKKATPEEIDDYVLYVPESWTVDMSTGTISAYYSSTDKSNITVTVLDLEEPDMTLDAYWEWCRSDFASFNSFTVLEEGTETTLGKEPNSQVAKQYRFSAVFSGVTYHFYQIHCIRGGYVYTITYTATAENYESHRQEVASIVDAFRFL